jgi:hypothetical protein
MKLPLYAIATLDGRAPSPHGAGLVGASGAPVRGTQSRCGGVLAYLFATGTGTPGILTVTAPSSLRVVK